MIIFIVVNEVNYFIYKQPKNTGKLQNKSGWNRGENSTLRDFSTASNAMSVGVARDQTIERTLFVMFF